MIISSNKKYGNSTSLFTSCLANCILLRNKINIIFNFIHSAFRIRITFCWRSSTVFMMWMKLNWSINRKERRDMKWKITSLFIIEKTLQSKWDFMYKYSFEECFLMHKMRIVYTVPTLSLLFFSDCKSLQPKAKFEVLHCTLQLYSSYFKEEFPWNV